MTEKGKETVKRAAAVVMAGMIVSRLLGYGRYKAIAYYFGLGWKTDAFLGAFAVPDLLYILSSGGALGAAFIPVFSGLMEKGETRAAWRTASGVWNTLFLVIAPCIILGMVFAPTFTDIVVPGFKDDPQTRTLCFEIVRMIFPMVVFTALSAMCNGVLQSMNHFATPALAWSLHNVGIIAAALLLHRVMGIKGLAIGVLAGAFSMVAVQLPVMIKKGMRYSLAAGARDSNVRKVLTLFLPAMLGLSISQINLFVLPISFGSFFDKGSVTSLQYAVRLLLLPLGVFGNALAMAVFPTLSRQAAGGHMQEFRATLVRGLRATFVFSLPCTAGFMLIGLPIVRLLFGGGEFTMADCRQTAFALTYYAIGLVGHTAIQVVTRGYYALQDTRTPFYVGLFSVLFITIPMCVGLILPAIDTGNVGLKLVVYACHASPFFYLGVALQHLTHGGVALAISLATLVNVFALIFIFKKRQPDIDLSSVLAGLGRITLASGIMAAACWGMARAMHGLDPALAVLGNIAVSGLVFYAAARVLRVGEVDEMAGMVLRRFRRS